MWQAEKIKKKRLNLTAISIDNSIQVAYTHRVTSRTCWIGCMLLNQVRQLDHRSGRGRQLDSWRRISWWHCQLVVFCLLIADKVPSEINPCNAELFLHKSWWLKGFFQFKIIINVLVSSFCFIWIPMWYESTTVINNKILPVPGPSLYASIWRL